MANRGKTLSGGWFEDRLRQEAEIAEHLRKKERGELLIQQVHAEEQPVPLSKREDSYVRVMMVMMVVMILGAFC